jgi:lysyl endopeptidase
MQSIHRVLCVLALSIGASTLVSAEVLSNGAGAVRATKVADQTPVAAFEEMPNRVFSPADYQRALMSSADPVAKAIASARGVAQNSAYHKALAVETLSTASTRVAITLTALPKSDRMPRTPSAMRSGETNQLLQVGRTRVLSDAQLKSSRAAGWQPVAGGYVWRMSVTDPTAAGMRTKLAMPAALAQAQLRVAGPDGVVVKQPIASSISNGEVWSGYTDGETQTIEVFSPVDPGPAVQPAVTESVYFYESLNAPRALAAQKQVSGACNRDVQCGSGDPALDAAMAETKKAVTWLNFNVDGGSFICTGTLINSAAFPRAFIMTANHCIGRAATAASVTTFWFRETTACDSDRLDTAKQQQVAGGARFSFTNFNVDGTLLELNQPPPAGVLYAAWSNARLAAGQQVVGLSHPRGDPIKLALGPHVREVRPSSFPQDMYGVQWATGQTEGGSSGSGLFRFQNGSLLFYGTLFGQTFSGSASTCTNKNPNAYSVYGRFEVFQPQISEILRGAAPPADDAGNTIASARPMATAASVNSSIGYAGDIDVYRIDVTEPGLLSHSVDAGTVDLVSAVLDANGEGLKSNDDVQVSSLNPGISYRVSPGTYYVAIAHFDSAGQGAYKLTTRFDRVTANYNDIWWNAAEDGWGINIAHQGNILFSALYTYERDGSPLWLVSTGQLQPDGSYRGALIKASGPAFNALPWNSAAVSNTPVGEMTIRFPSADAGTITYTYQGSTVTKSITRFQYGKNKTTCDFSIFDRSASNTLQDVWWLSSESGWGMTVAQQDATVFAVIYTYDASGKPLWLVAPAATLQGTGSATAFVSDLYTSRGSAFDAVTWTPKTSTLVGTLRLTLTNSARAAITYTVNGVSVTKNIERFTYALPASDCER